VSSKLYPLVRSVAQVGAVVFLTVLMGCVHLPAELTEEFNATTVSAENNYEPIERAGEQ